MIRKSRDYGVMNIDGGIRAEFNKLVDVKPFHNNNEINIERAIIKKNCHMIRDFKEDMLASPSYGDSEITVERRYYARNQC